VQGNYIGTDAAGHAAIANQFSGVEIESPSNSVGGTGTGAGNVISGNTLDGIFLLGASARSNVVQGNWIGTAVGGTTALPNQRAGLGLSDAPGNLIGGVAPGAGNVVSGNANAGIYLVGSGVTANQIQGNIIGANTTGTAALGNALWGLYLS